MVIVDVVDLTTENNPKQYTNHFFAWFDSNCKIDWSKGKHVDVIFLRESEEGFEYFLNGDWTQHVLLVLPNGTVEVRSFVSSLSDTVPVKIE